jgi:hypothetical protein
MKNRLVSTVLFLLLAACQGGGSTPAIRLTLEPMPAPTQGATPTYNIVTLVAPVPTPAKTQTQAEIPATVPPTVQPSTMTTAEPAGDRPLLISRLLQVDYSPQATKLVIGFDVHPLYRGKPGVFGEVYDAKLTDQTGREIAGISNERSEPEKTTLEFAPLPAGVTTLTLRAQLALRGVPAQAPLAIDVSNRPLDQAWPIQTQVRFGDVGVQLHTARLLREEIGVPPDAKQQVSLELRGDNAELNGAQLICIFLSPLPPPVEGSVSCGQEPSGIQAAVSLGPVVDRSAALPMPAGLVLLEAAGDFLLPGYWETTWPVE